MITPTKEGHRFMSKKIYITPANLHEFHPALDLRPLEQAFYDAFYEREGNLAFGYHIDVSLDELSVLIACAAVFFGEERASEIYNLAYAAVQHVQRAHREQQRQPRVIEASAVMHPAFLSPRGEEETTTRHWTYDDPDYIAWAEETFLDPGYDLALFPYSDGAEAGTSAGVDLSYADVLRLAYTDDFSVDGAGAGTPAGGREAGTPRVERRQAPWPRGPKAGTSSRQDGREAGPFTGMEGRQAGYSYTGLQPDPAIADGWRSGRHVARDGAGAGTPLQAAGEKHNDGAGAGTPWHPLDDVAVDGRQAGSAYGSYDSVKQGQFIARLLARRRGR